MALPSPVHPTHKLLDKRTNIRDSLCAHRDVDPELVVTLNLRGHPPFGGVEDRPTKILPRIFEATLQQSQTSTRETLAGHGVLGTPGGTRTHNLLIRSQDAYQPEVEDSVVDQQRDQQFRSLNSSAQKIDSMRQGPRGDMPDSH